MVVWRGVQGRCGVFFQIYSKLIKIVCQLLILQSAGGWCLVICNVFIRKSPTSRLRFQFRPRLQAATLGDSSVWRCIKSNTPSLRSKVGGS